MSLAAGQVSAGFSLGRFASRHYRLCALLVLALMACNVFLGLATSTVNDYDEARYGVSAFEMQQQRDFVVTTYAGKKELWSLKPPLGYWLMALSFSLFGGSALALRLPSALCALAAVAVTMGWAQRRFDRRLAILSGLILATTFGFLSHHGARSGDFDACLTLILLLVAVRLPGLAESPWRVLSVAALFACGFLLKGFAIVPMAVVAGAYVLWTGAWRRQRLVPCLAAAGLFLVITGAWALARCLADGSADFLVRMFKEDVLARSTAIVDKSSSSPLGYVTALFDRFAPWPLLILAAAGVAGRAGLRRRQAAALLVLWVAIPLAIISLVRTQHHWYLDPLYPPLAMLAAGSALFLVKRSPPRLRTAALAGLVALPLALCEGRLLARVLVKEPMSADQRFLAALRPSSTGGCREIRSTFQLLYSERFLLEVVDGFAVAEPVAARPAAARLPDETCLLVGKRAWRLPPSPPAERLPAREHLLAESASYALYRSAARPVSPVTQWWHRLCSQAPNEACPGWQE
ncbi:MAG TPA: glycosyltransferase family 39 protein [Thermoanaerobaculia bacterium]|nr:glycosyltransferase family 39 protein [Thermoanaerobaculia bacterium]